MMYLVRIFGLGLLVLWLPLSIVWVVLFAYVFLYGPLVPLVLAVLLDWYFVASIPYLTIYTLCAIVCVPFVQSRLVFYTR